jgi:hypothetical protein
MNPSLPPRFFELHEYPFQELCCDLFEKQDNIATCEIYGTRGQRQLGIDLLAHCKNGSGIEVGQCKCYENIGAAEIEEASDDFFRHLAHWKARGVKRFILFVACDLDKTQHQEKILEQKPRFALEGILYEAWSARVLRQKLSPHRDVVSRHIHFQDIVDSICGEPVRETSPLQSRSSGTALAIDVLGNTIGNLATQLSKEKSREVDEIRELYRNGQQKEATLKLRTLKNEATYQMLDASLRARVDRMLAIYILNGSGDLAEAQALADQAHELDSNADERVLRILLVYHKSGPEAALSALPPPSTIELLNLQLVVLLQLGRITEIRSIVETQAGSLHLDAESRRIYTWALLLQGDIAGAQVEIQKAFTEKPNWQSVHSLFAIVDYLSALSVSAFPRRPIILPTPIPWILVKRDQESQTRLRRAREQFERLATIADNEERRIFKQWEFACLANDPEKQMEAEDLCQIILTEDPCNAVALSWAIARNYKIDLQNSKEALEASLQEFRS